MRQGRPRRRGSRRTALGAVVALTAVTVSVGVAGASDGASTGRLAGDTRIETAVAIGRAAFPDRADTVYLSRDRILADALAAGTLRDGPVFLVGSCNGVPPAVAGAIGGLAPQRVVALGGPDAVCEETLIEAADGRPTDRLAGEGRIETAAAIARAAFPDGAEVVYVAAGTAEVDALVASTLRDGPVVLSPTVGPVPAVLTELIEELAPSRVVAVGGELALPDEVLEELAAGRETGRLAGADRFATAAAVADAAFPEAAPTVYLARADDAVDAVAGGALTDGPILLVPPCGTVPGDTRRVLDRLAPTTLIALGGERAVCPWVLDRAAGHAPPPEPTTPLTSEDADQLAAWLTAAERTVRAGEQDLAWLSSMARWQHAIYRRLTVAEHLRAPVLERLPGDLRAAAQEQITAGAELRAMVTKLRDEPPDTWRIVEPPPIAELRGYYDEAQARYDVGWNYLAAIHLVETRFGKIQGTSSAGAQGPMQFMPSTWEAYGEGGDVNDPHDAIMAAARYLRAHGAPHDMDRALYAYNHDTRYVRAVTRHALLMVGDQDTLPGYHQWQVWYLTTKGDRLLPIGWPDQQ